MPLEGEYVPSPAGWVREQVEAYESSGGQRGNTLRDTGLPVIIVHILILIIAVFRAVALYWWSFVVFIIIIVISAAVILIFGHCIITVDRG